MQASGRYAVYKKFNLSSNSHKFFEQSFFENFRASEIWLGTKIIKARELLAISVSEVYANLMYYNL